MKVHVFENQAMCVAMLEAAGALDQFVPTPPSTKCDGLIGMKSDNYLAASNCEGIYTCYFLEGFTKEAAFAFLDSLRSPIGRHVNARIKFLGDAAPQAANN